MVRYRWICLVLEEFIGNVLKVAHTGGIGATERSLWWSRRGHCPTGRIWYWNMLLIICQTAYFLGCYSTKKEEDGKK